MKTIACIFVLLVLCNALAFGAISRGVYKDPKHPGKCAIKKDLILSPGQEIKDPNEECGKISCEEDSVAILESCSIFAVQGCTMGDYIDKSKPFPDCCERHLSCVK